MVAAVGIVVGFGVVAVVVADVPSKVTLEVGEARKLGPTETKAVRVGRHEFFGVRAMKTENEWAAIIDADGSSGELRTGDQLHRIGITKMKEYFESAAWKQAITDKKQEKRFAVMKKRIHENMSDKNGGTEWVVSRRYEKVRNLEEFKNRAASEFRQRNRERRKRKTDQGKKSRNSGQRQVEQELRNCWGCGKKRQTDQQHWRNLEKMEGSRRAPTWGTNATSLRKQE